MLTKRILVGLSGGVDSSVSALLLKNLGYHVEGLFMKNWEEDDTEEYCAAAQDLKDAEAVCDELDIPLHKVNFAAEYWDQVFENFLEEYKKGRTPNPDILCNKYIKFTAFLNYAEQHGFDYIATGHYAQLERDGFQVFLNKSVDTNKDQTYFLYALNQFQLEKTIFPVGHLTKAEVRAIAENAGLPIFAKKDSTGICFIGERKFNDFLKNYLKQEPGDIVSDTGTKMGTHNGLFFYTLGQRQGIGIGGQKETTEPWYVVDKDLKHNRLIVAAGHNHPLLFKPGLICHDIHWIGSRPDFPFACNAKIRYRQTEQACVIEKKADHYQITFNEPQRAITPGQSIVFYQDHHCLGGGIIEAHS